MEEHLWRIQYLLNTTKPLVAHAVYIGPERFEGVSSNKITSNLLRIYELVKRTGHMFIVIDPFFNKYRFDRNRRVISLGLYPSESKYENFIDFPKAEISLPDDSIEKENKRYFC